MEIMRKFNRALSAQARTKFAHQEINLTNIAFNIISLVVMMASLLAPALAQGQQQQKATSKTKNQTEAASPGAATPGRIAKFTGTKSLVDSNITEDDSGKIGVG